MDKLDSPEAKVKGRFNSFPVIAVVLLAIVLVLLVYRFKGEKRFAVVQLYGNGVALNLSKNYNLTGFSSGNKTRGTMLAEQGDVLGINNTFIHFKNISKDSMHVTDDGDSLVLINGKINSIVISGNENLLPWFRSMKAATISDLQSIRFSDTIPGSYISFLKEIARIKPNTALVFEAADSLNVLDDYIKKADFFYPQFVNAAITQQQFSQLARWKTVECFYLDIMDSAVTIPLPAMPALKQCIIFGDDLKSITASFFNNNPQLEKLILVKSLDNYALLQPLNQLQEISLNNTNKKADIAVLKKSFSNLSVLILAGDYKNIDSLTDLKKLRWLGLPANTTQRQFNTIAAQAKELEVLELQGNDAITSLTALQQLHNLRGLIITDTIIDKQLLYSLKELRYLSVPNKDKTDSIYMLALQKVLPGCIVVPNSGACLGSGWLLLLIPLALIFFLLLNHRSKKNKTNAAS